MNPFRLLKSIDPTGISHLMCGVEDIAVGALRLIGIGGTATAGNAAMNQNNASSQEGKEGVCTESNSLDVSSSDVGDIPNDLGDSIDIGHFFS